MTESGPHSVEFLVSEIAGQCFAFDTRQVASALAPRTVTPLPFVPDYIEGLINVNDRVLALINLDSLLALHNSPGTKVENTRSELLVLDNQLVPCAVRVDRIVAKVDISSDDIDPVEDEQHAGQQVVSARFQFEQQQVLVLNADVMGSLLGNREQPQGEPGLLGREESSDTQQQSVHNCLRFAIGQEQFALALTDVVEILDLGAATPLPGAPAEIEGLIAVRDEVLLALNLAVILGINNPAGSGQLLVIEQQERQFALRVDEVIGMYSYGDDQLRAIDDDKADVSAIIMLDRQLIGLLQPQRLLDPTRLQRFSGFLPAKRRDAQQRQQVFRDFLEIRLGNDLIGVPLDLVRSISERNDFELLEHEEDSCIAGAVHIKGDVLPVVDLGTLMKCDQHLPLAQQQRSQLRGAWVVVGDEVDCWAIPVAEARQIRRVDEQSIEKVEDQRHRFVSAIANLESQLMPIVSLAPLSRQEASA